MSSWLFLLLQFFYPVLQQICDSNIKIHMESDHHFFLPPLISLRSGLAKWKWYRILPGILQIPPNGLSSTLSLETEKHRRCSVTWGLRLSHSSAQNVPVHTTHQFNAQPYRGHFPSDLTFCSLAPHSLTLPSWPLADSPTGQEHSPSRAFDPPVPPAWNASPHRSVWLTYSLTSFNSLLEWHLSNEEAEY